MQKCVLIYDDDIEILEVCKAILAKLDYRIETKVFCENVIEDIEKLKPDIILMDLWIPKIGGEKAIHLMRSNESTKDIPVILFSANDDIEKISEKTKADGFLRKPFDIFNFKALLSQYLDGQKPINGT